MAKWLIFTGILLIVLGALWHFFPNLLSWFGKLPGDIDYQGENGRVFIPITSMVLVSILLSVLISLFQK